MTKNGPTPWFSIALASGAAFFAGYTLSHQRKSLFSPSQFIEAYAANSLTNVKKISLSELTNSSHLLRAEYPSQKSIAIFFNSKVGTHTEYLSILKVKQIFKRVKGFDVLLVDLADQSADEIAAAMPFVSGVLSINLDKVQRKTNPSVFIQVNNSLHKVKPDTLKKISAFESFVDKVSKVKLASSIKDLVTALKENNTKLDSLTVVYCTDGAPERREVE